MPHTTLIATDALAAELGAAGLVVVDCRYDLKDETWGHREYRAAHIPGAVYASLSHDLAAAPTGGNGRHPLPEPAALAATFGRLGISNHTQVVAYDQDVGMLASRLWWMLRYAGHEAVAVLDGGMAKWRREGRPVRSGDEQRPAATFVPAVKTGLRRQLAEVESLLHDPHTVLMDARAPERFEGTTEPLDRVAGHIPGAANAFYQDNVTEAGTMKPARVLRERYTALLGAHGPEQVVMYCGSGVSACHNLLAMACAGLEGAALYAGSWSEWSADPERPVETGPPRS